MANAIISVPHTGTHAAMVMLGMQGPQHLRGPRQGEAQPGRDVYGHCWHPEHPLSIEQWVEATEGRQVYMPVRDPGQLAWSWCQNHRWTIEWLHDALAAAVAIIKAIKPTLVDIRPLKVANSRLRPGRDDESGAVLVRTFPEYFGDYYGGQEHRSV